MRILIADDHALLSESLCMMLERDQEIEVIGVAYDGLQALSMCSEHKPDVILMDVRMPGMDGITATRKIKKEYPEIKVLILTSLEDDQWMTDAFLAGADGYLLKDTPPDRLTILIKCINWGYLVATPGVFRSILGNGNHMQEPTGGRMIRSDDLQIIKLISEGKSNSEIAERLGYAVGTVKNKITKIIEITGVENRAQLVLYAIKNNMV